jgi:hypothetical protein
MVKLVNKEGFGTARKSRVLRISESSILHAVAINGNELQLKMLKTVTTGRF